MIGFVFFLGFVVIMTIVGFKVIAPSYVQERIAATTLSFDQLLIRPPSNSAESLLSSGTFEIDVAAVLSGLSPLGGTLNSFPATLSYKGNTFGTFTMPTLQAAANSDQKLSIVSTVQSIEPAFTMFAGDTLLLPNVDITLAGTVSVTTVIAGTSITVPGVKFIKTVTLKGCNGLRGGVVTKFSLTNSTDSAAMADISVSLFNPSVVGILPLGDFGADVVYNGYLVGRVVSRDAIVLPYPQVTSLNFTGVLINSDTPNLNALISSYLSGLKNTLSAVPRRCRVGEYCPNSIPLFAPLLDSGLLVLNATLPPSPQPLITGVDVQGMYLEPAGSRSVGIFLNATVRVSPLLGYNSRMNITGIGIECVLMGDTGPGTIEMLGLLGVPTSALSPAVPAIPSPDGSLGVSLSLPASLDITESDAEFTKFVSYFINAAQVNIALQGSGVLASLATVQLSCVLGNLTVAVPIGVSSVLRGIQGFPGVIVEDFQVLNSAQAPPGTVGISIGVVLFNPSIATFPLGVNATLGVDYEGFPLGLANIFNTTLAPGNNTVRAVGYLSPPPSSLPAASALFSGYLGGNPSFINVTGVGVILEGGIATPRWLSEAVQSLTLTASIPGLSKDVSLSLISNTTLKSLNLDMYDSAGKVFYPTPVASGVVCALVSLPFSLPVSTLASVNVSVTFSLPGGPSLATLSNDFQETTWAPCTTQEDCRYELEQCNGPMLVGETPPLLGAKMGSTGSSTGGVKQLPSPLLQPAGVLGLMLSPKAVSLLDPAGFSGLVAKILRESSIPIRLEGLASPTVVGLPFGAVALSGIPLLTTVSLLGLANLTNPPAAVYSGQIYNTSTNKLQASVTLNVTNPSSLSGVFGPVNFGLGYYGGRGGGAEDWDNAGGLPSILVS